MLPFIYQTIEILYLILYTYMLFISIILRIEHVHIRLIAMSRHTKHAVSLHACLCHPLFPVFPRRVTYAIYTTFPHYLYSMVEND